MRLSAALLSLTLALAGCAYSPSRVQVGESGADVQARVGAPSEMVATPAGERWIYPTGPLGQYTYAIDVDAHGWVIGVEQLLTDANFATIRRGEWDKRRVHETFGPPAETSATRQHHEIWAYRYRQDGVWNSLMYVYFDPQGLVADFHPGPDPFFEPKDVPDPAQ